jgi:RHS repeat-associated protein
MKMPLVRAARFRSQLAQRCRKAARWCRGLWKHWDYLVAWKHELAEAASERIADLLKPCRRGRTRPRRKPFYLQLEFLELRTVPSTFQFSKSNYAGVVGSGTASAEVAVTVKRAGSTVGPASVEYTSSDNTASAGVDYDAVSGELHYAAGQSLATFSVTIYEDDDASATLTYFMLNLSDPVEGVLNSSLDTASVTIVNQTIRSGGGRGSHPDDGGGGDLIYALSSSTYTCDSSDQVMVTVVIENGTGSDAVDWSTSDDEGGVGPSGELDFGDGVSVNSICIDFTDSGLGGDDNEATISLSTATEDSSIDPDWQTATIYLYTGDGGGGGGGPAPPSMTNFVVTAASTVTAGSATSFTVTAEDQYYDVYPSYSGTVNFTSTDGAASLPGNSTLVDGVGTFSATLYTAGYQNFIATDTVNSDITGQSSAITVDPGSLANLAVLAPTNVTAGDGFAYTVAAEDAYGNIVPSYSGTVAFTSTDGAAVLPANSTLEYGVGAFSGTLYTAGSQTLTATDTVDSDLTGAGNPTVSAAAATHFAVSAPGTEVAGADITFTVTAQDAYNNTAAGYTGTVEFTSTAAAATLPADSTLEYGVGTLTAALKTAGTQTLVATDTVDSGITGHSGAIVVSPAAANHFEVSAPTSATAGVGIDFTVTAQDPFNNTVTGYTGTVHFTSNDTAATLPANSTLASGVDIFTATLKTAGTRTITATDSSVGTITGHSGGIVVNSSTVTHFQVTSVSTVTAGVQFILSVTPQDAFNNAVTGYTGLLHLSSSDGGAYYYLQNATMAQTNGRFPVTLYTAGTQTVTVTTSQNTSASGSTSVTVVPARTYQFALGVPSATTAGVAFVLTVTAEDQFKNLTPGYTGTVSITASDSQAVLPANAALTSGTGNFSVTLKTAGSPTITASDTVTSSISGLTAAETVSAAATNHFAILPPTSAITGTAFTFTVVAEDAFNNPTPTYAGTVHFTSGDSTATLPANSTLSGGVGIFSATFGTTVAGTAHNPGSQKLTATDTATSTITGVSAGIVVHALTVISLTATTTGFVVQFNKPISPTTLDLFNSVLSGSPLPRAADISVVKGGTAVAGSVLVTDANDPEATPDTAITFVKTGGVLATGTYTVTLDSGSTGIEDTLGGLLDGTDDGSPGSNYVATFSVTAPSVVLGVPDFARGPNSVSNIEIPNDGGTGIPITLSGASNVTSVTFQLSFNPALLNISGVLNGSAGFFVLVSNSGGLASFEFRSATALSGTLTLGQIVAQVPNGASASYGAGELLHLSNIVVNSGGIAAVGADGVQVVAYLGDANGDETYDTFGATDISRVASGYDTGFAAYPLFDPVITGDINDDGQVTSADTDILEAFLAGSPESTIPPWPAGMHFEVSAPSAATAGTAVAFTLTLLDAFNNGVTNYIGTVHFTSTDNQAVLPANATLSDGVGTFSVTLKTAGSQILIASDTVMTGISGSSAAIVVSPLAATHFGFKEPSSITADSSFVFTVMAEDQYGNTATSYAGTVHFSGGGSGATLPANSTLVSGVGVFSATLTTASGASITVTDTGTSSLTGTSNTVPMNAGPVTHFALGGVPSTVGVGNLMVVTVTAEDQYNNPATGYVGMVQFSSSDNAASLPGEVGLVGGSGAFEVALNTTGSQTISVTDTAASTITGSVGVTVSTSSGSSPAVTLSLAPSTYTPSPGSVVTVPINVSSLPCGLIYANLILDFDPAVFGVSPSDVTLASALTDDYFTVTTLTAVRGMMDIYVQNGGTGLDETLGSSTLVTVNFHVLGNAPSGATKIDLAADTNQVAGPTLGFETYLEDNDFDTYTLNPAPIDNAQVLSPYVYSGSDSNDVTLTVQSKTHFDVVTSSTVGAGVAFPITVIALNGDSSVDTTYSGTVHFTSSDGQAVLPANATLSSGVGVFSVTLKTAGSQTVTATDANASTMTGSSDTITVNPYFAFSVPTDTEAGEPFVFTVTAQNEDTSYNSGYTGTVHFTSSDSGAVLPGNATLSSGVGVFSATLMTAGSQTLIATDTVTGMLGTSEIIANAPRIVVTAPTDATAGSEFHFTVTAENGNNSTYTGYTGTLEFTSTDGSTATSLPGDSALVSGTGIFSATLTTAGDQAISASDTVNYTLTGSSSSITVSPLALSYFDVIVPNILADTTTAHVMAGDAFGVEVIARDEYGNTATSFTGTVSFTSNDTAASLPANGPLTNGVGLFEATLNTADVTSHITATDTSNTSITGSAAVHVVASGASPTLTLTSSGSGSQGNIVTASIEVSGLSNGFLSGYFDLYFDPAVFSVSPLDLSIGTVTSDGSPYSLFSSEYGWGAFAYSVSTPGLIVVYVGSGGGGNIDGTVAGTLATINFHVLGNASGGTSTIDLAADDAQTVADAGQPVNTLAIFTGIEYATFEDGIFNYTLPSPPQDNTLINPYSYSGSDSADAPISVSAGEHLSVNATPVTGRVFRVTVTAQNSSGSTLTSFTSSVQFASTDSNAVLPADAALVSGVGVFSVTLGTAGSQLLTVTDTSDEDVTGTSNAIAATPSLEFETPSSVTAGAPFVFTVTAFDQTIALDTLAYSAVQFTSTDVLAGLESGGTLTAGVGTFTASLSTVGTQFLSGEAMVDDEEGYDCYTGESNGITVLPPLTNYVRSTDPAQGQMVAVGNEEVLPSTGNVLVTQALNLNISPDAMVLGASPALVYNSGTSGNVYPIVEASYTSNPGLGVPTELQARLDWGNTGTFPDSGAWTPFTIGSGHSAGDTYDLALQVSSAVTSTGYYPYVIQVQATYGGTSYIYSGYGQDAVVVEGTADPYGQGWSLAGVDQLVAVNGGVLWVDGATASARFFAALPNGNFVSPANDFGTLTSQNDVYVYTATDQTQWLFDSGGLLSAIVSPDGSKRIFNYNSNDAVSSITDADGSTAFFDYNGSGKLDEIEAPGYRFDYVNINGAGDLTSIIDADGGVRTFTYDGNNQLVEDELAPLGPVTFVYSSTTHTINSIALDAASVYTINPANVQALGIAASPASITGTVTDPLGGASIYTMDILGRTTMLETPDGGNGLLTETWTLNVAGLPLTYTDAQGNVTSYVYAANGDVTQITYPDLTEEQYTYDPTFNEPLTDTDRRGFVTTNTLNAYGEVVQTVDAAGDVTTNTYYQTGPDVGLLESSDTGTESSEPDIEYYTYDGARRLATTSDESGDATTYQYDSAGNNNVVIDPRAFAVTTAYDAMGEPVRVTEPDGTTAYTYYDLAGNVTETIDNDGDVTENTYDAQGRLSTTTTAVGTSAAATMEDFYDLDGNLTETVNGDGNATQYGYDSDDRLTLTVDANGNATSMVYDKDGNVTESFDANGQATTYAYNADNELISTTDPDHDTSNMVYDADGNVTESFDADGNVTKDYYDADDRLTLTIDGAGASSGEYYDKAGNVTETFDGDGHATTYAYNADNELISTTDADHDTSSMVYDKDGNVTESFDAKHNLTTYAYDAEDRVTAISDGDATIASPVYSSSRTVYDPNGNVVESFDGDGNETQYAYDADGRLTETIDGADAVSKTYYDKDGNVTETIDGDSHATRYLYDADDQLTMTIDAAGNSTESLYDKDGNITESIDADGNPTEYLYDADNRLTMTIGAAGDKTSLVYDKAGNVTESFDADNHLTTYAYDGDNRVTAVSDGDATSAATVYSSERIVYDGAGNVLEDIDGDSNITSYAYDGDNRVTLTIDGNDHSSSMMYDAAGNLTGSYDAYHHLTSYAYNADNEVVAVSDAVATSSATVYSTEQTVYDKAGNVTETIDGDGHDTQYTYDGDDRVTQTIDGAGDVTSDVFDGAGNVTESFDAGQLTNYVYDSDNRQIATIDPAGDHTTTMYDAAGNVTGVLDPNYDLTQYVYDQDERQTVTIDPMGDRTTLVLDNAGNTKVEIDADGNRTSFTYDASERLTVTQTPLGLTTMVLDKAGLITETMYPATGGVSENTTYSYDRDENLLGETWFQGGSVTNIETFAYDNAENMTLAENNAGAYTMTYDADDRVCAVQEPYGLALSFTYDDAGNRTQVQDSLGGLTTSAFNGDGQLTSRELTSGSDQMREDLSYQSNGLLSTMTRYSNIAGLTTEIVGSTTYQYDVAERVTAITDYSSTGTVLLSYTYGYDAGSRLTSETDNGSLETYGYNADSELTYAGGNNYHYDADGDRSTAGYTDGTDNEITNDGTWTYTYDNRGNVIGKSDGSGDIWTYTYDNANEMTSAVETSGGTVVVQAAYTYDVFGNRIKTDVTQGGTETVTKYGYDGWNPALQSGIGNTNWQVWVTVNGSGSVVNRNLNGDGVSQVLGQIGSTGTVSWFLTDHLGSVVGVTSSTGAMEVALDYDAYGNLSNTTSSSGSPMPVTPMWAGLTYDSTLSFYISASRYYDPVEGRWITQDPSGLGSDSNPYRYGGNAPTNATDPSGLAAAPATGQSRSQSQRTSDTLSLNTLAMNAGDNYRLSDADLKKAIELLLRNQDWGYTTQTQRGAQQLNGTRTEYEVYVATTQRVDLLYAINRTLVEQYNAAQRRRQANVHPNSALAPEVAYPLLPIPPRPTRESFWDFIPVASSIRAGIEAWEDGRENIAFLYFGIAVIDALTIGRVAPAVGAVRLGLAREVASTAIALDDAIRNGFSGQTAVNVLAGVASIGATVGIRVRATRVPVRPTVVTDPATGRIISSSATIRPENLNGGTATTSAARALATPDDAGHIMGRLLGGQGGATSDNIFAQLPAVNRGAFRQHEAWVASQVRAGRNVHVTVEFIYPNTTSTRPSLIRYYTTVDGVTTIERFAN